MKFVRFTSQSHPNGVYGIIQDDDRIIVLRGGLLDTIEETGEVLSLNDIQHYLPPINPPNLLAFGVNYIDHASETEVKPPLKPLLFIKANTAVIGHEDNIVLPKVAPEQVDYEAELCVIIGRQAHKVSQDEALDYVFGYTCGHDVSSRDCQFSDGQWARGKSFDTFAPLGPYVVTDLDPTNCLVRMRLNGETMQDQSTEDLIFSVAYLVSYLSHSMTLLPGTVIMTGTPGGVGFTRKPPVFLKPGDVCEVDIEGIGVLRNSVVSED